MDHKRISKAMSLYLRHEPERIGLTLEPGGWVRVNDLLEGLARVGLRVSRETLQDVVAQNNKQRFAFDATQERIRANQGHSVPVDLQLVAQIPPDTLYHGTNQAALAAILENGLLAMQRHHVHLSPDTETALVVGARRAKPVLLRINAKALHNTGAKFYRSENGVWLTDTVPANFLERV